MKDPTANSYLTKILHAGAGTAASKGKRMGIIDNLPLIKNKSESLITNFSPLDRMIMENGDPEINVDEQATTVSPQEKTDISERCYAEKKNSTDVISRKLTNNSDEQKAVQTNQVKSIPTVSINHQEEINLQHFKISTTSDTDFQKEKIRTPSFEKDSERQAPQLVNSAPEISDHQIQSQPEMNKIMRTGNEVSTPKTEDDIRRQNPNVIKEVQPRKNERIPIIEVLGPEKIYVPESKKTISQDPVSPEVSPKSQFQGRNEQKLVVIKDKKTDEMGPLLNKIEILQKSTDLQKLNTNLFTESLKKKDTQLENIAKDISRLNKKLNEHIYEAQKVPNKPAFLPKRPVSRNLGGWSNLERNYIR